MSWWFCCNWRQHGYPVYERLDQVWIFWWVDHHIYITFGCLPGGSDGDLVGMCECISRIRSILWYLFSGRVIRSTHARLPNHWSMDTSCPVTASNTSMLSYFTWTVLIYLNVYTHEVIVLMPDCLPDCLPASTKIWVQPDRVIRLYVHAHKLNIT